jgi:hypothetical protein
MNLNHATISFLAINHSIITGRSFETKGEEKLKVTTVLIVEMYCTSTLYYQPRADFI